MKSKCSNYKICFSLLLLQINLSCNNPSPQQINSDSSDHNKTVTEQTKPPSSFSDTVSINIPAAVFYNPDSSQLKKIRAVTEPGIFESTMHELFYQMRNARIVLKQHYPHIKIEEVVNTRYLLFKMNNGEKICIDLNSKNDPCGLFMFDGKKAPVLADMTNIDTELGFYFSK